MRAAALFAMLFCVALPVCAATPSEFYASLLRRGVAAYETQRYDDAARSLRLAAFGFVENVEQYQTAHVYLALTHERMGVEDRARDSARRVIAAQRVERRFMSLPLPPSVRTAFDALAARVLTAPEVQLLRAAPPATATTTQPSTTTPTTGTATPGATTPATTTGTPGTMQSSGTIPSATPTQPRGTTTVPPATTTQPPATTNPATTPPQPRGTNTQPPVATQPRPTPAQPQTTTPRTTAPKLSAGEVASRLIAAERALSASNLTEARGIYRELLAGTTDRATLIRIAEGFYRARDFQGALSAFQQLGTLQRGEEAYRYYVAVALYETGQYDRAKRELAAALPFIEITPDVARYRTKIEGALH